MTDIYRRRTSGPGSIYGGGGAGVQRTARPSYSNSVDSYNRGFGSSANGGRGDSSTTDRPFQLVGKNQLNLVDPLARTRQEESYFRAAGIEAPKHEGPLGFVQDYYDPSNPAGLVGGLVGALGQTIGGVFGEGGAKLGTEIGGAIGKTVDVPFNVFSQLPLPTFFLPFVDDANAEIEKATPYLFRDVVKVPKTAGDLAASLLNGMGLLARGVERTVAGGRELPPDLAARVEAGEIDEDTAYDMMVMEGRGFTDDPMHNLFLNIALDPVNWASLGIGAVGAAARGGLSLARLAQKGGSILNAAEHGAAVGRIGDMVRAGQLVRAEDLAGLSRLENRQLRIALQRHAIKEADHNPLVNYALLARTHMVPSAREVLGNIDPQTTSNLFYRAANRAINITDPTTFLGGRLFGSGNIGKRQAEYLATASQSAVFAAYGADNIHWLNGVVGEGGSGTLLDALGVHAGNTAQEFALSEHIGDGMRAGKVPILSGADGHSLSSTEASRAILRGGAYDSNVGKHMELHVQKQMPALFVRRAGETEEALRQRLLEESRGKLQSMLGPEWDPNSLKLADLTDKRAALIHASYYYHVGASFHNEVVPAIIRAQTAGALPAGFSADPSRLTLLAERQLTSQRADELEAALKAGNANEVRRLVARYRNFDWLDTTTVEGSDLITKVQQWLDVNRPRLPRELDLIDPATGQRWAGMPPELERWLADADAGFGYTLAEGPPANIPNIDLYGAVRNADGMLEGMDPWLDFLPNPGAELGGGTWRGKAPSRIGAYLSNVTQHIRQERIRWEGQRRFITDMSKMSDQGGVDLPPAVSQKLWRAIMSEAEHQRIQPRGLAPDDFAAIVRRALADSKKVQDGMTVPLENLSHQQVMNALLRATKGDLWTVGGTQWFTGRFKQYMPGAGQNLWGRIAENLFPQLRFALNPVFQLQELAEPYILNRMRGVKAPLDRNSEGFKEALATHNAIMQLVRTSVEPDGMMSESAEYLRLYAADMLGTRQTFGAGGIWGRISAKFRPGIQERKAALAALEARSLFGERFYRSVISMYGETEGNARWRLWEEAARSLDRGEVAMKWMATNMHLTNTAGEEVTDILDLTNPHTFGPRLRITHDKNPGAITFSQLERTLDGVMEHDDGRTVDLYRQRTQPDGTAYKPGHALLAELRSISEQDWMLRAKDIKHIVMDDEAIRTIWRMANAPAPKDFWREYRRAFLQQVTAAGGRAAVRKARDMELAQHQAIVRIFAESEGITEAEYIARHFQQSDYIQTLSNANLVPGGALLDMRPDWMLESLGRTDFDIAPLHDIQQNLDGWRAGPQWENEGDYYYKAVVTNAIPKYGGQELALSPAQRTRGWADIDAVLDEARYDPPRGEATVVRLPKTPKRKHKWLEDDNGRMRHTGIDTNELEVFDPRQKRWRPMSEFRPYEPNVPDFIPPTKGARGIYVPRGTPERHAGLHPIDINAYLDLGHETARQMYKGDAYAAINTYLRGIEYDSGLEVEQIERAIARLDEVIARGVLPQRKQLYRGVNLSRIEHEFGNNGLTVDYENLDVDDIIDDAGYQSFTEELKTAENFAEGGGHAYEKKVGQLHKSVYIHLDAPPGMNVAYLAGQETEHLLGQNQRLRVVRRTKQEFERDGIPHVQYDLHVVPDGVPYYPGRVNRLMLEDLTPTQQVNTRLARDAVNDPDGLRTTVDERLDDVGLEGAAEAENAIAAAAKSRPASPTSVADSLAEDLIEMDAEELNAAITAISALRGAMQDLAGSDELGMRLLHALAYAVSTEGGMALGWKELVGRLERLWDEGTGSADTASREAIDRALFKGIKSPQRPEPLESAMSDTLDVMLGNRSRRAVGRGEVDEPVIVDQLTMMEAGYPEGTVPNEYTHEFTVGFYNRKAREANAQRWQGRADWSAAEMGLLAQLKWQKRLGKSGIAVDAAEVDSLARTLTPSIYPPPTSDLARFSPLIDILFERKHREQMQQLMDELGTTLGQQMRDELGVPIIRMDGSGMGKFDRGAAQPMVPVSVIGSDGRADDVADVLSYITGQDVMSFKVTRLDDATDLRPLVPRLSFVIPNQGSDELTEEFASRLGDLMTARGGGKGAAAYRVNDGDWVLQVADEEGVFKRLDDGSIDEEAAYQQLDSALDELDAREGYDMVEIETEYGEVYHAGPDRLDDGTPDWEGHRGKTETRLSERGSRLASRDLDSLRATYDGVFREQLRSISPKQYRRIINGESPVPGILEDRRGGSVRGFTDIRTDTRAIIGAVGNPDPLTGLHELVHVHARTLDPSAKQRVIAAYEDALTVKRQSLEAEVAELRAKAANARSQSWRTQYTNKAIAKEAELGSMPIGTDWGTEHEEFLVQQFMRYVHQGRAANPEMRNVMEHFGTWTRKLTSELFPDGEDISPQMAAFFDNWFRKHTPDMTIPYSVEHETLRMAAKQQLREAWDEAHGTHYYRKDRRWFERSVNHPYIGMYPASYMWGKVMPELFRFLALRPFGYETPMLAWNVLREVSDTMTYQAETNEDFGKFLESNERMFMLMSMMFPGVPNDMSANASLPLRRVAEQSLMNQYKNAQGVVFGDETGQIHDINYLSGMEDAINYAIGPLGALRTGGELIGMGQKMVEGLNGPTESSEALATR